MFRNKLKREEQISVFSFIVKVIYPFRWLLLVQIFISLIWAVDLSLRPYLVKIIINRISEITRAEAFVSLMPVVLLYIAVSLFVIVVVFRIHGLLWLKINPYLKKHISIILLDRLTNHSHHYYQSNFSGNVANKFNDVVNGTPSILHIAINQFLTNVLALFVASYTVRLVDNKFAIGFLIWVVLFLAMAWKMSPKSKVLSHEAAEVRSTVLGQVVDILVNMMNIRLFNGHSYELKRIEGTIDDSVRAEQKRDRYFMNMYMLQSSTFVIFQAVCLWWLVNGFREGAVTAGDFVLILTINISIIDCLENLSHDIQQFAEIFGNMSQGLRIINSPIEITDKPKAEDLVLKKGEIVFDKVKFHYKGAQPLFKELSVVIKPGQKVGLVGYSGSGKTTFVNLILRLFDINDGKILIDKQDIREVSQKALREVIAIIPQDPILFHRSLLDNIRYGRFNATDKEIIEAAKFAYAHEFIVKLPEGYQTTAGERGVKLSGGQRQRIAIARAILKNAPILILDEATSQLDSTSELLIQECLWNLMENRTTIAIAHRLSTLLHMDRIMVFDQGKIVADGTHEELINKNTLYKTFWDNQVHGFIPMKKLTA